MTVCREKGITCIYIPIWVAFNETKYSPALLGAAVFHVFIFYVLHYVPDYSVFCALIGQKDTARDIFEERM